MAVSGAATVLGRLFSAHMRADGIAPTPTFGVHFATTDQLQHNFSLILDGLAYLGGAHTFGEKVSGTSLLGVVVGGIVVVGFVAGLWFTFTRLRTYDHDRRLARLERPERVAFLVFWGAALMLSVASYLASDLPQGPGTGRYLVPAFYAVAVLLPALALGSARARAYVAAGVPAFTVGVLGWHIAKGPEEFGGGPTPADVSAIYTQLDMLPRGTGKPIASGQFGRLTVHVFDHDVARDLEAAPAPPPPPAP